jgi:type VI secretion system protein ImpF
MAETWGAKNVGWVPLFDRLIDDDPADKHEAVPMRALDRQGLRDSIRRELARLLGTRCPLRGDEALSQTRTVLDYGLPDIEDGGRALITGDQRRIGRLVQKTIEAFEPRLRNVTVRVDKRPEHGGRIYASIEAIMVTDDVGEALSFTMPIGPGAEAR